MAEGESRTYDDNTEGITQVDTRAPEDVTNVLASATSLPSKANRHNLSLARLRLVCACVCLHMLRVQKWDRVGSGL